MRGAVWYSAVSVWVVALTVCLVAALFDSSVIMVAFPVMMAAGAVAAVLCYGPKAFLGMAVPVIAGALLIRLGLRRAGLDRDGLVSVGIGVLVGRLDRGPGHGSTAGME